MFPVWLEIACAIAVLVVIPVDIWLAVKGGFNNTISYWMYKNSVQYPIIPASICLFIGMVIGHYAWNSQTLIILSAGTLIGHFWWDQVLRVDVQIGNSDATTFKVRHRR